MTPEQERLVLDHRGLVHAALKALGGMRRYTDRDGLIGAGNLALCQAAARYDPAHGVPFHRWAFIRIRGAILDEARQGSFGSRRVHDEAIELWHARSELAQASHREPTPAELAAHLIWPLARLQQALAESERAAVCSLEVLVAAGADRAGADGPQELAARAETRREVHAALAALTPRQRAIVTGYYWHGRGQADLAAEHGVTTSRISQILAAAARRMRPALAAAQPSAA